MEQLNVYLVPTEGAYVDGKWSATRAQEEMRKVADRYAKHVVHAANLRVGLRMVTDLVKSRRAHLRALTIFDHASRDNLTLGTSDIAEGEFSISRHPRTGKVFRIGDGAKLFQELAPLYENAGWLVLRGCEVANGAIPEALSQLLPGIMVMAFYEKQSVNQRKTNGLHGRWKNGRFLGKFESEHMPDLY